MEQRYVIETSKGLFVKNGKEDTNDITQAKRFKCLRYLRTFASNYGITIENIIQDCGNGNYCKYERRAGSEKK